MFNQVTDIHVTHLGNFDRMKQFEEFCNEIIKDLVKPSVTVVSGKEMFGDFRLGIDR